MKEEASCDDKENSIDNSTQQQHQQKRSRKHCSSNNDDEDDLTTESLAVMADCETASSRENEGGEDVNGNLDSNVVNGKSMEKDEPDDENSIADDNEMEPGELNFNPTSALEMQEQQQQAVAASAAALSEANALFNNATAMFQQPGMSMQTFQNAIAQFTANAIANNMDNETVMKNLAILQSALFTLQQQQFLQFQLIQHLQSQLVNKKNDGSDMEKHNNNKSESDDEEQDSNIKMKDDECDEEEDGEMEEINREHERQNQIHKRLMENKHFSKMQEALLKESENR